MRIAELNDLNFNWYILIIDSACENISLSPIAMYIYEFNHSR